MSGKENNWKWEQEKYKANVLSGINFLKNVLLESSAQQLSVDGAYL